MSDEVYEDGRDLHAPLESWTRFAEVMGQRMSDRRLSKAELHRQSGLDRKTITKLQRGEQASYFLASIGKLEDALGWPRGTVRAFLEQPDQPIDRVIADIRSRQQAERWARRDTAADLATGERLAHAPDQVVNAALAGDQTAQQQLAPASIDQIADEVRRRKGLAVPNVDITDVQKRDREAEALIAFSREDAERLARVEQRQDEQDRKLEEILRLMREVRDRRPRGDDR